MPWVTASPVPDESSVTEARTLGELHLERVSSVAQREPAEVIDLPRARVLERREVLLLLRLHQRAPAGGVRRRERADAHRRAVDHVRPREEVAAGAALHLPIAAEHRGEES